MIEKKNNEQRQVQNPGLKQSLDLAHFCGISEVEQNLTVKTPIRKDLVRERRFSLAYYARRNAHVTRRNGNKH